MRGRGRLLLRSGGNGFAHSARAPLARSGARDGALDAVGADLAAVLRVARREADLVAAQAPVDGHRAPAVAERSGEVLKALLERELPLAELPGALDFGRHDPQIGRAALVRRGLVGLPLFHRERVRNDASARL